jgi:hypothetical protein
MLFDFLTMSPLIIDFIESMISFLSGSVPYGELYLGPLLELYDLIETTRVNRTNLFVVEAALAKSECKRRFTHTSYMKVVRFPSI